MSTVAEIIAANRINPSEQSDVLIDSHEFIAILDHTDALEAEIAKLNSREDHNSEQLWRIAQLMGKGPGDIYSTRDVVDFSVAVIEDHAKLKREVGDLLHKYRSKAGIALNATNNAEYWEKSAQSASKESAKLREALEGASAWLNSWASHVGSCSGGDTCTCGLTFIQQEAALSTSEQAEPQWQHLSCDEQFELATKIASNVGYTLKPDEFTHDLKLDDEEKS